MRRRRRILRGPGWALAGLLVTGSPLQAQDPNIHLPPAEIEALLRQGELEVTERRTIRTGPRATDLVLLDFGEGGQLPVKWARAPDGGEAWNNTPRYEMAAYEVQKLFLEPGEYVVPPTVCRCFTPERYAGLAGRGKPPDPTFRGTRCVLVVLQYWLQNVTSEGVWDDERLREDEGYARHLANLDVLTHLIEHKDANTGNFLVSTLPASPRVFAVDNGLSFRSPKSPVGYEWRWLRVKRIPRSTAERLRSVTRDQLHDRLGVLAQFELHEGGYRATRPSANLDPSRGIRVADGVIQLGLEAGEVEALHRRIRRLVRRLDSGELKTF